jgi:hypothetical protein
VQFARDFLKPMPAEGDTIPTAAIQAWIEQRRRAAAVELVEPEHYLDVLSA